jgi:catechol 2,3-dioxygenase-like lactoylglutathione lyase family enzyme
MSKKEPLLFRMERIEPILRVKDMAASRAFYIDILGFKEEDWGDDNFTLIHHEDKGAIYLCKNGQGNPGTWIWLGFDGDIFFLYNELKERGVVIRQPPVNYSYALEMQVEDPDGHVLRFGTDPNPEQPFADAADV